MYDQELIREAVEQYYIHLYTDPFPVRPVLEGVDFDHITPDQSRGLERPFSKEEILEAIHGMVEDKAPSPDGFPIKFLIACWRVVKKDILKVFLEFYSKDKWCKSLNATFISLILKKKGVAELKDYRPINLMGCIYKILAKTLANRLKTVLPDIILESQHAFIPSRQMTDCSLLANEGRVARGCV